MPLPRALEAYADVERAFKLALAAGEATQPMPPGDPETTRKLATRWRHRAYHYRRMLQNQGRNEYNQLVIRLTPDSAVVTVEDFHGMPEPVTTGTIEIPDFDKIRKEFDL